jgi:hypothetical protein
MAEQRRGAHGDLDFTQILTRHYSDKSQTVSQLTNSGTVPTRQVSVVQSLRVIETSRTVT